MVLSLSQIPVFVINLDRSHDRWVRFYQSMSSVISPHQFTRVSGVDGRGFQAPQKSTSASTKGSEGDSPDSEHFNSGGNEALWKFDTLRKLQTEGFIGKKHILDPVRSALCLSHQRALHQFLDVAGSGDPASEGKVDWGLIFEDDVRPGEALAYLDRTLHLEVPDDSELLFLHDRVWRKGASEQLEQWRIVRGGIGLEAYLVNVSGARKMLQAFTPVVEECDVQLMTFIEGYADLEAKEQIWSELKEEGHCYFPKISAYAPVRPYFQTDHWIPSVKFATIDREDEAQLFQTD